jgi:hypothetical protein
MTSYLSRRLVLGASLVHRSLPAFPKTCTERLGRSLDGFCRVAAAAAAKKGNGDGPHERRRYRVGAVNSLRGARSPPQTTALRFAQLTVSCHTPSVQLELLPWCEDRSKLHGHGKYHIWCRFDETNINDDVEENDRQRVPI